MTQFAWKFGVAPDKYQDGPPPILRKNALTLLNPINPAMRINPTTFNIRVISEVWQRKKLRGFTTQQLQDLDVITSRTFTQSPFMFLKSNARGLLGMARSLLLKDRIENLKRGIGTLKAARTLGNTAQNVRWLGQFSNPIGIFENVLAGLEVEL